MPTEGRMERPKVNLNALSGANKAAVEFLIGLDNISGRMDYPFFVTKVLGHDFPEIWDPRVQEHLERVGGLFKNWVMTRGQQKKYRKIMDIRPRGTCKSAGVTIPLVPYAHLWDTEIAAMVMSAEFDKMAKKFSDTVRQVWSAESPDSRLVDLYGQFAPNNTRQRAWSAEKMVTQRREQLAHADPTLRAYSVSQGPTSGHFKLAIIDDPITEELMERNQNWLDQVWGAYNRMDFVLDNDALLYLIMTRYGEDDLIGRIIKEEIEPATRAHFKPILQGDLPDDWDYQKGWIKYAHLADWEVFYDEVYENYEEHTKRGDEVYKVIWPHERIADVRKTERGERLFWPQLMNQPAGREDRPIRDSHIEHLWMDRIEDVPKKALRTIDLHCDFSFKDADAYSKQRGDWGVIHVCAKEGGYVYRIGGYRGKDSQEDFGKQIVKLCDWIENSLKGRVRYITYEQTMGHGSGDESTQIWLHQLFMNHAPDLTRPRPFAIRRHKQGNKSKLQRIMDTNWAWQEGYVQLVREAPNTDPLIYQMLNQGYSKYDDDADAFADAFHEELYKKTRPGDLPEGVQKHFPGYGRDWQPLPAIFGSVGFDGKFTPERRTARNPQPRQESTLGNLFGGRR